RAYLVHRQVDGEPRSSVGRRLAGDVPPVTLDHTLHQTQTEPEAAVVPGVRAVALGEVGEGGTQLGAGHALAMIENDDLDARRGRSAPVPRGRRRHHHLAS